MGNSQSLCQEAVGVPAAEVRVKDLLSGESTEDLGSEASNDGDKPESAPVAGDIPSETEAAADEPAAEDEPEEEEEKATIHLTTAPIDPRFPTSNAARYCYVAYNEYHKCIKERGDGNPECTRYARNYRSICPTEWIDRWNELREEGAWFGKY